MGESRESKIERKIESKKNESRESKIESAIRTFDFRLSINKSIQNTNVSAF